jgi:hypothetical protein
MGLILVIKHMMENIMLIGMLEFMMDPVENMVDQYMIYIYIYKSC